MMTLVEHMSAWQAGTAGAGIPEDRIEDRVWCGAYYRGVEAARIERESYLPCPERPSDHGHELPRWPSRAVSDLYPDAPVAHDLDEIDDAPRH